MKYDTELAIKKKIQSSKHIYFFANNIYREILVPFRNTVRHLKCKYWIKRRKAGYEDSRFVPLKRMKNIYDGKRCFIVCTGPSLALRDVEKLKTEYTFGMNGLFKLYDKTQWRATYYAIIDPGVYEKLRNEAELWSLNNVFIPDLFLERFDTLRFDNPPILFPIDYKNPKSKRNWKKIDFSDDAYTIVYDYASVTFSLMQIAVYMGFKEIYLLGCDCNYSGEKKHFVDYGTKVDNAVSAENKMILAYSAAKKYADSNGIKIYNATRGGKLEVFERVDFDSLFDKKE